MSTNKPRAGTAGAATDTAGSGQLGDVSTRLAEMISSLRRSREAIQARAGGPALTPLPVAPASGGVAGVGRSDVPPLPSDEPAALRERIEELEAANRGVGDEFVGLQAQIAHAVSLSVTLRRLHEAADRAEVLEGIAEAVVSLLGCERFAVLLAEGEALRPARTMGLSPGRAERLAAQMGAPAATGKPLVGAEARVVDLALTALVPLAARGQVVGALALEALLPHRGALGPLDGELLEVLGRHGALAYLAAPETSRG